MGQAKKLKTYSSPKQPVLESLPRGVVRSRPRAYAEWKALRRWGKLPAWEPPAAGYALRAAREEADMTQARLAERLGISQQAVAQAERVSANPTVDLISRWARACGADFVVELRRRCT